MTGSEVTAPRPLIGQGDLDPDHCSKFTCAASGYLFMLDQGGLNQRPDTLQFGAPMFSHGLMGWCKSRSCALPLDIFQGTAWISTSCTGKRYKERCIADCRDGYRCDDLEAPGPCSPGEVQYECAFVATYRPEEVFMLDVTTGAPNYTFLHNTTVHSGNYSEQLAPYELQMQFKPVTGESAIRCHPRLCRDWIFQDSYPVLTVPSPGAMLYKYAGVELSACAGGRTDDTCAVKCAAGYAL